MSTPPTFTMPGQAPPLAQPSFFTGPQDNLAVANPYTAQGGVVNSITNQLANLGIAIPDVLKGGASIGINLPLNKGKASVNIALNPAALAARLAASIPGLSSAFQFVGDLESDAAEVVGAALSVGQEALVAGMSAVGTVVATIGGVATTIASDAIIGLQQLGGVVASITNGAVSIGISDLGASASVIGGLVGQLGVYGIPNVFGALTAGISLEIPGLMSATVRIALPSVLKNSDALSLIAMAAAVGSGAMINMNPNIAAQYSSNYSRTSAVGGMNGVGISINAPMYDSTTYANTMQAYSACDPNWNTCTRNGVQSGDISSLTGASSDFNSMVSNGVMSLDPSDPLMDTVLAQQYGPQDVMTSVQTTFPNTAITTGNSAVTSSSATNDPQSGGILDTLSNLMPGLSLAQGGAQANTYTQQLDAYNAAMAQQSGSATSGTSSVVAPSATNSVPMVATVWGTLVPTNTHTLLGYTQTGTPVYADDPYRTNAPLFPTPN
jgi:hypothetical protein